MNLLQRNLPNSIRYLSKQHAIKTDFVTWLNLQKNMQNVESEIGLIQAVKSVFLEDVKILPNEFQEVINSCALFIVGARGYSNHEEKSESVAESFTLPMDFELDSNYIYSSFLEQYGIDLFENQDMHYYKFVALFESLNENTIFQKIVGFRTADTGKIKDKTHKRFLEKMKRRYQIVNEKALSDFEKM